MIVQGGLDRLEERNLSLSSVGNKYPQCCVDGVFTDAWHANMSVKSIKIKDVKQLPTTRKCTQ